MAVVNEAASGRYPPQVIAQPPPPLRDNRLGPARGIILALVMSLAFWMGCALIIWA